MRTSHHNLIASILLGGGLAASGELTRPDFTRYQPILDRKPFGSQPVAPIAPVGPAEQLPGPDAFTKTLRMCAITEAEDGLRVGLIDLASKPPRSFFLYIGDMEDGIELVDAEYAGERAKLRKGAEEYWISMGDAAGAAPNVAQAAVAAVTATAQTSRRSSYADRLKQRREAEQARLKELAEQPAVNPQELEKSLQKYQMDVLRRGQPPLPIPLTPEMDDQLVKEGVLPPL